MAVITKHVVYPNYQLSLDDYKEYLLTFPFYTEEILMEKYDILYTTGEIETGAVLLIILYEETHKKPYFESMTKSKNQDIISSYSLYKLRKL